MATGYSGTALVKKLGIKEDIRVQLINAPEAYFDWLEVDISSQLIRRNETPGLVHLFASSNAAFESGMKKLEPAIRSNPSIIVWVSWYKKSSGIATDLTEDIIRQYALRHGLVDVKVCAVSESWSGLKLVVPLSKR
jgi:hypothetical protein